MKFAVVFFGAQTAEHKAYFEKHGHEVLAAPPELNPFAVHTVIPGYDFLLCWNATVVPEKGARDLRGDMDMSKINVSWDSFGRNFPHKTSKRFSTDLIGFPRTVPRISYELLEMQDLHILPKDVNVCKGYKEFEVAVFKRAIQTSFVKKYDPVSGRYV
jgi:hypothetical protein